MRRILPLALSFVLSLPLFAETGFTIHSYPSPNIIHLVPVDLNRDGYPDLVTYGDTVDVYLNDGHGGLLPRKYLTTATFLAIADFNNDGLPDIGTCHRNLTDSNSTVSIYLNQGGGTFSYASSVPLAGKCTSMTAGDVNGDGNPDIVMTWYAGSNTAITTFFGSGSGAISRTVTQSNLPLPAKNFPSQTCFLDWGTGGDFQQADRVDMVLIGRCSGGAGTVYYGTSDKAGHYSVNEITESDRSVTNLPYTADVNGDGRLDVVLGDRDSQTGNLEFLINNGGGNFTRTQVFSVNTYAGGYLSEVFPGGAADFDHDGKWEAVVGFTQAPDCCKPPTPGIAILKPDSSGNYVESQRWTPTAEPDVVVTADFNQDGKPDIATFQVNNNTGLTSIVLYLNTGAPACAAPASPGVHLCSPVSGSTYNSPVKVQASGKASNASVLRYELWIDGKKVGNFAPATVNAMDASVPMSSGTHRVVVVEDDSVGGHLASPAAYIHVN